MGIAYDYAVTHGMPYLMLRKRITEPLYESKPEWWFWSELGHRLSYGEYFPWKTEEEVVGYLLKDTGITLRQLIENPSVYSSAVRGMNMITQRHREKSRYTQDP